IHVGNSYGPAGSLIIILIWLYYSAQILFIGAEIVKVQMMFRMKLQPMHIPLR
ncbi:MAG: YhjD/YihY/BrkB family envelope integrity protein, partial [bacterium]|nr:YhjD/YihY/BrkB family envelope integrity protein [bacterium]